MPGPGNAADRPAGARDGVPLTALVVEDEAPAREELAWLLRQDERVGTVLTAGSGTDALRALETGPVDVVFSDISMPGLDGMELARILARFADRPQVVFVTAHDAHAVTAFALDATDYVMKPVRPERLAEAVRRVVEGRAGMPASAGAARPSSGAASPGGSPGRDDQATGTPGGGATGLVGAQEADDETIPVELGGVTRFVSRSQISHVQAQGDYARLHTATGSHLVRIPLTTLEERWGPVGFVRIHRSTLVSMAHVREVRMDHGRYVVVLDDVELQVSRRHTRDLRDRFLRDRR